MELVRKIPAIRWFARIGAVLTTASLAVLVPAMAWASTSGAYDVAVEAARSRRRGGFGFFGVAGLLCCLVVVAVVVVAVLLVNKNRKRR
ncbi:hypothetical protein [Asanoa siamensis]|uniref:Uncharacterized protein n=1 Tax=Asanoa siamensis TaxID=926357 RepID=A0ABQ4CP50_9ACTN|nr:hypothetical protein [Asanoa siamensis]GIF72773.1 hypothetical protein Asi02nite_22910 [Asanoa siamensis]